ncbi:MAG TPA: hypothetical protein VEG34_15140 [Thermoanaerobaculia bacterium]|nr:hypothetical protein [Thermoanaerobaculia bacterium]
MSDQQNPHHDDDRIRRFLLGELAEDETETLERRLLAEEDLFEAAEAMEADLLYSYVRETLSPAERERLRKGVLATPGGLARLAEARDLAAVLAKPPASRVEPGPAEVIPFKPRPERTDAPATRRWWAAAVAASLLAAGGIGYYHFIRQAGQDTVARQQAGQDRVAQQEVRQEPQGTGTAVPPRSEPSGDPGTETGTDSVQPPPVPTPELEPVETPEPAAPLPQVFELALMGLRSAGALPLLKVEPGTRDVELRLALEGQEELAALHVAVTAKEGEDRPVASAPVAPTHPDGVPSLVLTLPAERLANGRYRIEVSVPGDDDLLYELEFEVTGR